MASNASGIFGSAGRARRRGEPRLCPFHDIIERAISQSVGEGGRGRGRGGDGERECALPLIILFTYLNYIYILYITNYKLQITNYKLQITNKINDYNFGFV